MHRIGAALQVVGLVIVTAGAALIALWLGLVVGGASTFAVGFQLERESQAEVGS